MKERTKELLTQLQKLHDVGGEALFDRLGMAVEVADDEGWVAEHFDGVRKDALKHLQVKYFSDLGSVITMVDLLAIRRRFTDKALWREKNWNLRVLLAMLRTEQNGTKEKHPHKSESYKTKAEVLADENERLKAEVAKLQEQVQELEGENLRLKDQIVAEVSEKDVLRGRLLERDRNKQYAAA